MVKIKEYITIPNIILLLLCMFSVSSDLGGPIYYGILVLYSIYKILSSTQNVKYNKLCITFILIALISTLINYPITEPIFRVEQRIIMLIIVMIAFSPLITNRKIYVYRKKIFIYLLAAITICALISSIMGIFGVGFVKQYLIGIFDFPNSLGYAQGLSIIFLASLLNIVPNKIKLLCILGIILFIITIPLTGTRTAFYSIPVILLGYTFLKSHNIKRLIQSLTILSICSILFLNYIQIDTSIIDKKNEVQEEYGTSRDALWGARIKEFKSSPLFGIGTFRADLRWSKVNKSGNVEAGNSFLMMLSMNGLLGFINFCLLYFSTIIPFYKYITKKRKYGLDFFEILLSLVILFNFINMQQAGILLNAGLYFTGINWLAISLTYKIRKYNNSRLILKTPNNEE